jgi:uncharacterized membrane protein (UPF0136 family)
MTSLQKAVAGLAVGYGLVSLIGGIIGFVSKGSVASIVAGAVSGCVLFFGAYLLPRKPKGALLTLLLVSILLVGRFISATSSAGPSSIAVVMILGGSLLALVSGIALGQLSSSPTPAR